MVNIVSEGILFILSSPSGAGKTTIAHAINNKDSNTSLSISCTTRAMRPGETQGKDYHFTDREQFLDMVSRDQFLEYAIIYDNLYGTPKDKILDLINSGKDVIFDIDSQGAAAIKKLLPQHVVSIFIMPPSLETLRQRLESRSTDDAQEIDKRFKEAVHEISHHTEYDFVVVNAHLSEAVEQVHSILKGERLRRRRLSGLASFIENL